MSIFYGGTFGAVLVLLTACGSDGAGPNLDPVPQIETRPLPFREGHPNITLDRASKVAKAATSALQQQR
jgi:hypothetical protein